MRTIGRNLFARVAGLCTALAAGAVVAAGCVHHHHHEGPAPGAYPGPPPGKPGPPPHAPAHGYRRKNPDGIEVVFDVGVGVYVVLGHDGIYWDGGRYLRWRDRMRTDINEFLTEDQRRSWAAITGDAYRFTPNFGPTDNRPPTNATVPRAPMPNR